MHLEENADGTFQIAGTPKEADVDVVEIIAENATGTTRWPVNIKISPAGVVDPPIDGGDPDDDVDNTEGPVEIVSKAVARGRVGNAFGYVVLVNGAVDTVSCPDVLPLGLKFDNQRISGVPKVAGTYFVRIVARGGGITDTMQLKILIE